MDSAKRKKKLRDAFFAHAATVGDPGGGALAAGPVRPVVSETALRAARHLAGGAAASEDTVYQLASSLDALKRAPVGTAARGRTGRRSG
jgi:hypothetical protein